MAGESGHIGLVIEMLTNSKAGNPSSLNWCQGRNICYCATIGPSRQCCTRPVTLLPAAGLRSPCCRFKPSAPAALWCQKSSLTKPVDDLSEKSFSLPVHDLISIERRAPGQLSRTSSTALSLRPLPGTQPCQSAPSCGSRRRWRESSDGKDSEHTHAIASLLLNISCWAGEWSQNYHQLFPKLFWQRFVKRIDSPGRVLSNVTETEALSPETCNTERRHVGSGFTLRFARWSSRRLSRKLTA